MADQLTRKEQSYNWSAAPNKVGRWGCSCCRLWSNLNHHRKATRKKAKAEFRQELRRELQLEN